MNKTPSAIYLDYPENSLALLQQSLNDGLRARNAPSPVPVYFRADDIGVISQAFVKLMALFERCQVPLCLAVVPSWLTARRWSAMSRICDTGSALWCWHQHGWRHRNHQCSGKKSEFGSDRSAAAIRKDIINGRNRLQEVLGSHFSPFFTPPWNRCCRETEIQLQGAGFKAMSTDRGGPHPPDMPLPDLPVNVDLHTRKERDGASSLLAMAAELETAAGNGAIGFMIHHQRMDDKSFTLLKGLLDIIQQNRTLTPVDFRDLV